MKEANLDSKINLSEYFPGNYFTNLLKVFPQLNNIISKKDNFKNNSVSNQITIDKYPFYQMVLEKVKNYFEIKENFLISDSIDIILKDIKKKSQEINLKNKYKTKIDLPFINTSRSTNYKYFLSDEQKYNKTTRHFYNKSNLTINKSRNPSSKSILQNEKSNKKIRNFSTKSNGQKKLNELKYSGFNKSFYEEDLKNNDENYVYLDLNKNENQKEKRKLKVVQFAKINTNFDNNNINNNETAISNPFSKTVTKKSNLKKSNFKKEIYSTISIKQSNESKTITEKTQNNFNIKEKKEILARNKSNGQKLLEKINIIESTTGLISPNTKISLFYNENNLNKIFNIDDKDFDIINFDLNVGKENTLVLIGKYIYNYFNFKEIINMTKFENWCQKITEGYNRNNSYHTDLHAADITHTSFIYFKIGLVNDIIKLDKISICALFLSCICHDYKHPGFNNNYLMETNNPIALNYNDISILENMHISEAFKLIHSDKSYNVFENFDKEKYKKIRKQMISCVLGTDMSKHQHFVDFMNNALKENKINESDKQEYMDLIVHSADISNPTKIFDVYYKWANLVVEEFYHQGDKEKELGLNCSCDRNKVTIYKSQLGFIDFIEIPFYDSFVKIFPNLKFLFENLNNNRQIIKLLEEEDNKIKEEKN